MIARLTLSLVCSGCPCTNAQCALHFILSSSIDGQVRGDEGSRCNQLQQYSAASSSNPFDYSRKKRYAPRTNYLCDIEMMKDM